MKTVKLGRLKVYDIGGIVGRHVHGFHGKDMIVLHETVSPDYPGLTDILGNAEYLAKIDYGIHSITDKEGNKAWAYNYGNAIFYQCGGVNTRSVGIEQVSEVMLQAPTNALRRAIWAARTVQMRETAKMVAAIHRTHPGIPLVYSNGLVPGVTSHWDVSQHFPASLGHTDCFPVHKGGYYPILTVINLAKTYYRLGIA